MKVLYVDDDRVNSLLFVEACRFAPNVEVSIASNGAQALQVALESRPDLLVIDLHLPDTDGYKLLPELRRALNTPGLPALLCTADEAQRVEGPAREAGFDGCWTKPVDLVVLLEELSRRNLGISGVRGQA
jgi:CheY-like chemotaxis protein